MRKHGCCVCEHLYDSDADSVVFLRGEIFQYGVEAGRGAVRDEEILFQSDYDRDDLGFLFNLAQIPLPGGLDAVFSSLSGCMSPLALLLVGSTLLDRESTSAGLSKDIVQISLFRLIIAPFLTWIVGVALHLSTPQLIAAVLVNATPVASTATIFCRKYNGNTSYTSRCVFFSTVFSLFTLVLVSATMSMG